MIFLKLLQLLGFGLSRNTKKGVYKASTARVEIIDNIATKTLIINPKIARIEIAIFRFLINLFKPLLPSANIMYISIYIKSLQQELNLINEVKNIKFFHDNFEKSNIDFVNIPLVYEFSPKKLRMEYMEGTLVSEYVIDKYSNQYCYDFLKFAVFSIFFLRYYHADLHPGNIILKDGKVNLIDFANCQTVSKSSLILFMKFIIAIYSDDVDSVFNVLNRNNIFKKKYNKVNFVSDFNKLIFFGLLRENRVNRDELIRNVIYIVNKYKLNIPEDLVMVLKTMYNAVFSVYKINEDVDILQLCRDIFDDLEIEKHLMEMIIRSKTTEIIDFVTSFDLSKSQ